MISALKVILEERKLTQKDFAKAVGISKQGVSKWVLRQKPMLEDYICYIEKEYGIERKFFVDERRYCKVLDENEKLELEDYLLKKMFEQTITTKGTDKNYKNASNDNEDDIKLKEYLREEYLREEYTKAYRQKKFNADIKQLVRRVKEDIQNIEYKQDSYVEECLDMLDSNVYLYHKFLHLREERKITDSEWDCIFKALFMLTHEENEIDSNEVTLQIYKILKENRARVEQKRQEDIELYESIWGELPNEEGAV